MNDAVGSKLRDSIALRGGAASIYVLVGLLLGLLLAVAGLAIWGEEDAPSFAGTVFGVGVISALAAASFPNVALASLSPLMHFGWGLLNGSLVPESMSKLETTVGMLEMWFFWLGVLVGCLFLLAWLTR